MNIMGIMDDLTDKGQPLSRDYLSLWCRIAEKLFFKNPGYSDLVCEPGSRDQWVQPGCIEYHGAEKGMVGRTGFEPVTN